MIFSQSHLRVSVDPFPSFFLPPLSSHQPPVTRPRQLALPHSRHERGQREAVIKERSNKNDDNQRQQLSSDSNRYQQCEVLYIPLRTKLLTRRRM